MTEYDRNIEELRIAGMFDKDSDYDGDIGKSVQQLLKVFRDQGHSGFSAARTAEIFATLVDGKVLTPLKGTPNEWVDVSDECGKDTFQNKRCGTIFAKTKDGNDAYDINYFIFVGKNGVTFTRSDKSSIPISFPYMPRNRFVKEKYIRIIGTVEKIKRIIKW
ncbi:hypothetical protein KAT92_06465 [Candidatus Babeliales bacterium]|nr:hypothetical protein [Candidatus Babeliales bacterium]